jgi:homoserine acetyltransferase
MKTSPVIFRWAALFCFIGGSVSCMTTYDSAGRPVQSVDPAVAVAGAAAAGLVGYAIANDNDDHHHHYHGGYYRPYPGRYRY